MLARWRRRSAVCLLESSLLYDRVVTGQETKRVLEANSAPDYLIKLKEELDTIKNSEMWKAGAAVRALRPENRKK